MLAVLKRNPDFRRLWTAQCVSQIGDWLHRVAVLTLIGTLGASGTMAGLGVGVLLAMEIAVRFLPATVLGTLVGPLADRFPRRTLMIGADLARAALVASLVLVDEPGELWALYVVLFLQMSISMLFEAARTASVPNTLAARDLHLGNAISAATWSIMLSVGGLLGAFASELVGLSGVFLINTGTYLVSALLLVPLRLPRLPERTDPLHWRTLLSYRDLREGFAHARRVAALPALMAKASWGGAGGFLVILTLAAKEHGGSNEAAVAHATGIAYSLRGVGTGIGPFLGRRLFGSTDESLLRQIGAGHWVGALGYALFALSGGYGAGLAFVVFAHLGGSTLWVGSTTLWQRRVEDGYRGRAHTLEMTAMMLASALGALLTGLTYDRTQSLLAATLVTAAMVLIGWTAWSFANHQTRRRRATSTLLGGDSLEGLAPEAAIVRETPGGGAEVDEGRLEEEIRNA